MHWRNAAEQVEAGLATMLAWAAGNLVTASEMLRASDLVSANAARMVSLARIEGTSIEELQEMVRACRAVSARVALFDVRVRTLLAVMPGLATIRDATVIPSAAAIRHATAIRHAIAIRHATAIQNGAVMRKEAVTHDVAAMQNEGIGDRAVA